MCMKKNSDDVIIIKKSNTLNKGCEPFLGHKSIFCYQNLKANFSVSVIYTSEKKL